MEDIAPEILVKNTTEKAILDKLVQMEDLYSITMSYKESNKSNCISEPCV
jgi:hypothetical protein